MTAFSSDVTDPLGDVNNFIKKFEEVYGSFHPTFYRGTYSQVRFVWTFI